MMQQASDRAVRNALEAALGGFGARLSTTTVQDAIVRVLEERFGIYTVNVESMTETGPSTWRQKFHCILQASPNRAPSYAQATNAQAVIGRVVKAALGKANTNVDFRLLIVPYGLTPAQETVWRLDGVAALLNVMDFR